MLARRTTLKTIKKKLRSRKTGRPLDGPIDAKLQDFDKMGSARYINGYGEWVKHYIQEHMIDVIPDYVRTSDYKEMRAQYVNPIEMGTANKLELLLRGKSDYLLFDMSNFGNDHARVLESKSIRINTEKLYKINDQCSALFENAKKVIKKAESNLKNIHQIASGAEKQIKRLATPGDYTSVSKVGGKTGEEAKTKLLKYFNSLGQSVTYLISTATTTNTQVSSAFAKLISHYITINTNTCTKLASFADRVYQDVYNEWIDAYNEWIDALYDHTRIY